ncbi:DUF4145 domain-containing protein [Marinobacterium rhizophilum]|uniref:DUF4145 domain-containing protein n=1 Tax=Marinobacterium rhizophilum TaxID=420402 RepID=UPI000365CCD9|nr:DUF4145 domain-containing protein [Marinobacterium rhizophilum]
MDRQVIFKRYKELEDEISPHLVLSAGSALFSASEEIKEKQFFQNNLLTWIIKASNIIARTCGENSIHFKKFEAVADKVNEELAFHTIIKLRAIFCAAKDDFEKGFIFEIKEIAQAEIFEDELDQAQELLNHGYLTAAAVISGTVLECRLRWLCEKNSLPVGKLDKMNSDLSKENIYNKNIQKKITALAGIRNSAAHGKIEEFNNNDISIMIVEIKRFIEGL